MNAIAPPLAVCALERTAGHMAELMHAVGVTADPLLFAACAAETHHHASLLQAVGVKADSLLLAACAVETHHHALLLRAVGAAASLLASCVLEHHLGFAAAQMAGLLTLSDAGCSR